MPIRTVRPQESKVDGGADALYQLPKVVDHGSAWPPRRLTKQLGFTGREEAVRPGTSRPDRLIPRLKDGYRLDKEDVRRASHNTLSHHTDRGTDRTPSAR